MNMRFYTLHTFIQPDDFILIPLSGYKSLILRACFVNFGIKIHSRALYLRYRATYEWAKLYSDLPLFLTIPVRAVVMMLAQMA